MLLFRRKSAVRLDLKDIDVHEARHGPLSQTGASEQDLPRDREIRLICRSGRRSAQAAQLLLEAGHSAINVAGGMQACRMPHAGKLGTHRRSRTGCWSTYW